MQYESEQINQCLRSIEKTEMQRMNDRLRAKQHWDEELSRTQTWNNIKS